MGTKRDVDQFWHKHNFSAVTRINKPEDIGTFYIPPEHKELQYAAYSFLGKFCMGWPRQFPKHSPWPNMINDWREEGYYFCFGAANCFDSIKAEFKGLSHLANFIKHPIINKNFPVTRITSPEQLIKYITKEVNMKVELELSVVKTPKMKPRTNDRLVFTYTNGATYTVRGVLRAKINGMSIHYVSKVGDTEGNVTVSEVSRRITNEFATVVIEKANTLPVMLLDLRADRTKKIEKPPRKHKSREEYEAERAQEAAEEARIDKVEELLKEAVRLSSNLGCR